MLRHRVPSGLLMFVGLLLIIWADQALAQRFLLPGMLFLILVLVLIAFASFELATLLRVKFGDCSWITLWISGTAGMLLTYLLPVGGIKGKEIAMFGTGVVLVLFIAVFKHSYHRKRPEGAAAAGATAMLALVYLGVLPGLYMLILLAGYPGWVIAAIVLVVKACDVGAYTTGSLIGKHKLIAWLSPGKTWEGLIGGVLFAGMWAVIFTCWGNALTQEGDRIPWWYGGLAGLLLGFLGQVGDLMASLLKRDAGVKDWAKTIPGFGGVMDVADSPLLVAPVAYWLLITAPTF